MSCRISELVLNCADPELLARFWCDVLGYVELNPVDRDALTRLQHAADGLLEAGHVLQGELARPLRVAVSDYLQQFHVL